MQCKEREADVQKKVIMFTYFRKCILLKYNNYTSRIILENVMKTIKKVMKGQF